MSEKEKELAALRQEQTILREDRIADDSKGRLKKISNKKFNTCFIFALSEFERTFGLELWGYGLPEGNLNDDHRANRILWDLVRKRILDKGNTQARALGMEIDLHKIEFEGYRMDFGRKDNGQKD
jgi:hypothetical protein